MDQPRQDSTLDHLDMDDAFSDAMPTEEEVEGELVDEELGIEDEEGNIAAQQQERPTAPPPAPAGLKEISSLASWTVSSSKPGCGISALRAPSTAQFWQSDGPQPHHLNIHFFKMVSIVGIRIYLDFDLDESYTPTLVRFFAGTSYNDLQEFSVLRCESPRGWIDVDFDMVGEPDGQDEDEGMLDAEEKENLDRRRMPVLRAMLVQVKICENHQNGKDTHLRGLQIFARDGRVKTLGGEEVRMERPVGKSWEKGARRREREEKMWEIPDFAQLDELR